MSVCLGTKLKLSRKLLVAENYECLGLYNFSGSYTYVYENCRAIIERKQNHFIWTQRHLNNKNLIPSCLNRN